MFRWFKSWARTWHCSSHHAEAASHIPQRRIYNYVPGALGRKRKKIKSLKKKKVYVIGVTAQIFAGPGQYCKCVMLGQWWNEHRVQWAVITWKVHFLCKGEITTQFQSIAAICKRGMGESELIFPKKPQNQIFM